MRPFSSQYYDATRQAEVWWKYRPGETVHQKAERQRTFLKSRLRFDYLFYGTISLQRSDVLDGACLQHTTPEEICKWLAVDDGSPSPLEVRTLTGSLEKDLLGWVKPPRAKRLYPELFLLIPPKMRETYAAEFPKLNPSRIRNASDLATAIGDITDSRDLKESLSRCWRSWIDGQKKYRIRATKARWSKADYSPSLHSARILISHQVAEPTEAKGVLRIFDESVRAFLGGQITRGDFFTRLQSRIPSVLPWVNVMIAKARAEVDGIMHEGIMNADLPKSWHRLLLRLFSDSPAVHRRSRAVDLSIPDLLADCLLSCDYGELLAAVRVPREEWLEKNDLKSLRHLADGIADFMEAKNVLPTASKSTERIARYIVGGFGASLAIIKMRTGELGTFDTFTPFTLTGIVAAFAFAKTSAHWAVKSISKKEIVRQTILTFRDRGIVS